ncbi:DUF805 domain-containing protein [Desulfovibrio sp. JC022]|uniref:DUF805 domain-containing protein n=1 Tax=Desulfovibrio sp. JC022 TaxID=2593642 RepID=UPI0013D49ADF|nr:DUF805 domain-containing protein [Desulfovibrio sp. JC022]NDV21376.1 DUF805 domain-containing protein [Desulfovibrio sp. JC022]
MKKYIAILKQFNDFHGKASREEFIHFAVIHFAILGVFLLLGFAVDHPFFAKVVDTVSGLFVIGTMLPCIALIVRRFNSIKQPD